MTELLDRALRAIEQDPRARPRRVAEIESLVGRRHARRRAAVGALAAAVVVVAALGTATGRNDRPASPADERLEQAVLTSGVLVPTVLPQGLRFDSLTAQGALSPTNDPVMRQIVLADPNDPNRFLRVEVTPGGAAGVDWAALTRQMLPTTISGAQSAAYGMVDSGVLGMDWIKGSDWFDSTSYGIPIDDVRAWAASLEIANDGSLTAAGSIDGLELVRQGVMVAERARIDQAWRTSTTDGPWLDVRVLGNAPWSGPSLRLGRGEVISIGGVKGLYYEAPAQRTVAWLDAQGTQHEVASNGLTRAELLAVVDALVPLDAGTWHRLRSTVSPSAISNLLETESGRPGASVATTAVAVPRSGAGFRDIGFRVSQIPYGHGVITDHVGVVHTVDDRWVGISTYIEPGGGSDGCEIEIEQGTAGELVAWHAPCTGGRYAPDGACINERCVVGLRTFETRVVDDRVEMDPDRFHVGVPREEAS